MTTASASTSESAAAAVQHHCSTRTLADQTWQWSSHAELGRCTSVTFRWLAATRQTRREQKLLLLFLLATWWHLRLGRRHCICQQMISTSCNRALHRPGGQRATPGPNFDNRNRAGPGLKFSEPGPVLSTRPSLYYAAGCWWKVIQSAASPPTSLFLGNPTRLGVTLENK